MRSLDMLRLRLRSLLHRDRVEHELKEEFSFHLEQQTAENIAAGMAPREARYAALRALGGAAQLQEECRDQRGVRWIETVQQDLRYAVRGLRKSPAFTAVAVLSLALGIGANTAIFSLIDAVLLQFLPVREPQQLMFVGTKPTKVGGSIRLSRGLDTQVLEAVQKHATLLDGVSGVQSGTEVSVQSAGAPEITSGYFVDGSYFRVLGVPAIVGRVLSPDDDRAEGFSGQGWPAVISYGYWQGRFAGRQDIVGQKLTVNTIPFVIVGVTPPGFRGLQMDDEASLTMPMASAPQVREGKLTPPNKKTPELIWSLFVRLKHGVAAAAAEAELTPLVRQAVAAETGVISTGGDPNQLVIQLTPASRGQSGLRQHFSTSLSVLMVVVALVLLIACANIANLLLARASARQREIAIRLSLGCTRWRLARQLLLESLLLSGLGGAVGLLFALWGRNLIVQLATASATSVPPLVMAWDYRLLLFTGGVCVVTALFFGLAPALRATRINSAEVLKSGLRTSRLPGRIPLSKPLVALQVAISLVLLIGAVLFLGTLRNLYRVDLGYNAQNLLLMTLNPQLAGYEPERAAHFFDQVREQVQAVPQVESATWAQNVILGGSVGLRPLRVPGYVAKAGEQTKPWVITYPVGPDFFRTMQMPLAAGREFTSRDNRAAPRVAIMNQAMARHFFGQTTPIGKKVSLLGGSDMELVGIARDAKYLSLRDQNEEVLFLPVLQDPPMPWATLVVRTQTHSPQTAADIARLVRGIDANVPVYHITTMERQRDAKLSQERLLALLTGFFSLLALGLSAVGLYGVLAYNVAQRTGEIGIRVALGADRGTILRMICTETARVVGAGIAGGIVVAVAAARLVRSFLFGLAPTDTFSVALAVLVLGVVAVLATLLPARRAARVDPMVALRYE